MPRFGLTLSSEEHPPAKLVRIAAVAEEAGFDFVSISDHFHPWIGDQGHSPFVWSVLGAISQATSEIEVGVGVSCPLQRMHPVVSAQAAATTACLFEGRFSWGVGTGEALNEHVTGDRWPPADVRLDMLEEAVEMIRLLWTGESITKRGRHYTVEDARLFDLPGSLPPLIVSAFGESSALLAARCGDGMWTTGISTDVVETYRDAGGTGPIWSQLSLCWDPDYEAGLKRAHRLWPNTGLPGQLAQDLPTVLHMEQAVQSVTQESMAKSIPIGPDPGPVIESVTDAITAGIDHIYLHQIGDPLEGFLDFWNDEVKPGLGLTTEPPRQSLEM